MFNSADPWEGTTKEICPKLKELKNRLNIMGCRRLDIDNKVAKIVTMVEILPDALKNSEIWQMGRVMKPIQIILNDIYKMLLGVPKDTNTYAIHKELGVIFQQHRADYMSAGKGLIYY